MAVTSTPARGPYQTWFLGGGADDVAKSAQTRAGRLWLAGILLISRSEDGGPTIQMFLQRESAAPISSLRQPAAASVEVLPPQTISDAVLAAWAEGRDPRRDVPYDLFADVARRVVFGRNAVTVPGHE